MVAQYKHLIVAPGDRELHLTWVTTTKDMTPDDVIEHKGRELRGMSVAGGHMVTPVERPGRR